MTQPSKEAMAKARDLAAKSPGHHEGAVTAFALYIDKVSEVAKRADRICSEAGYDETALTRSDLSEIILPEPVDPLVEVLRPHVASPEIFAAELTAKIEKRGGKIV